MAWKEYSYSNEWSGDHIMYRPIIGLELSHNEEHFSCIGLIDSGCDTTLINAEIADALRIDISKCKKVKVSGIADKGIDSFTSTVNIKVEGFKDFLEMDVIFVPDMRFGALLGQKDFFEKFKVKFEKKNKKFYLFQE
ncbi:MAG: hypothetical protein V4665_00835 [Patescibacteria group bacterium]